MPIRGSLALVIAIDLVGALAFAGIGLLVACRATTTEAVSGLMNLVMLPMWLFSGVFFSSERFPDAAQPFIKALPLTQLVSAMRQVILDGAGLVEVSPALGILTAWTDRDLLAGPAVLPLDLTPAQSVGAVARPSSPTTSPRTRSDPRSAGTSTSSIKSPRNVALARISTSRNDEADWSGILASFSSRCKRHGEWTSASGRAKTNRRGHDDKPAEPRLPAAGRPAADHMVAVVDRLQERSQMVLGQRLRCGRDQHQRQTCPFEAANEQPGSCRNRAGRLRHSTGRPSSRMRSIKGATTASGRHPGPSRLAG